MISDFNRFKRLFVFGCSCTNYIWPTWADILSKSLSKDIEYYNFGKVGIGNSLISYRVSEASKRFKFTRSDLIVTMWTSITREDRFLEGHWVGKGNIYNQDLYPKQWVKQFADIDYYLIKDYALINLTNGYLQNIGCKHVNLYAYNLDSTERDSISSRHVYKDCETLYGLRGNNISLEKFFPGNTKHPTHKYIHSDGRQCDDGHPTPIMHYDYLKDVGFNLNENSKNYAISSESKMRGVKKFLDFEKVFPECLHKNKGMFK